MLFSTPYSEDLFVLVIFLALLFHCNTQLLVPRWSSAWSVLLSTAHWHCQCGLCAVQETSALLTLLLQDPSCWTMDRRVWPAVPHPIGVVLLTGNYCTLSFLSSWGAWLWCCGVTLGSLLEIVLYDLLEGRERDTIQSDLT
ncbi:uncharacterized protein LOC123502790 [Portunus trituberculatus]|uniref:uncharacterized protein LOC123502790 n=1 Tax=Portunus trituberculatus TaxID=210409 RepID=UPI001E1CB827|nr:uncharacterized protein LOC123502790 [Portunus trituberculatus]